jgi:isoquinoline 1-oxidoreductase beta subunit
VLGHDNGQAKYTIDHQFDGMPIATIARPPLFGAKVQSFDASEAQKITGVVKVLEVPQGVAVLATSTWAALKAQRAMNVTWDDSAAEKRGLEEIITAYKAKLNQRGAVAKSVGNVEDSFKDAAKVIEVDFEFPYLAHAPMEPMDCVIRFDGNSAEIWTGSQLQTVDHKTACGTPNLKPEAVQLHTVWPGGSFGRRAIADAHYVRETCEIAKACGQPVPIKVLWTREDDIQGGYYRPIYVHRIKAGLDNDGNVVAWRHRIVGQSILAGTPSGVDATSVEGAATLPYANPNFEVDLHAEKVGVPVLWWRSVGATHTAHATEHMIDILAKEAGNDPIALRLAMLKDHPRHAGVLKLEKGGAALKGAITLKNGAVEQTNFDGYEVLRMSEMPHVEVHIVQSTKKPTGVGEPGTPVVLPAVANALLWGTGVRSTVMPLNRQKYKGQA